MIRFSFCFVLFCLISCAEKAHVDPDQNLVIKSIDSDFVEDTDHIWICHHPGTEQHGSLCKEDYYPSGCYIPGDRTKFCWLLTRKDCSSDLEEDWQIFNCHYFER